jgi:radical SAM protein with 4Fe4S-binding SPASM domain
MDAKKLIKNKSMCVIPWTGFLLEPDGGVKNCVISKKRIGNINTTPIKEILGGEINRSIKEKMLADQKPRACEGCHLQETDRHDLESISSRLYYLKEIGARTDLGLYSNKDNFSLHHVDLRWTNSCNQACVYCDASLSSKWAHELGVKVRSKNEARQEVKDYVFENIAQLKNVYLAGGEPMLMKENFEFLKLLKEKNPECTVRVNTNLSTTQTGIFDLLCSFPNLHWTVSVESIEEEYDYIRHHGSWEDFIGNLKIIKNLNHKISFNMLHFILNYESMFDCIDYFKGMGFNDNSFIAGPLYTPEYLHTLNLPDATVRHVYDILERRLEDKPTGYLKNSYENLLTYYQNTQWLKDTDRFFTETDIRDTRRGTSCKKVFPKLYGVLDA